MGYLESLSRYNPFVIPHLNRRGFARRAELPIRPFLLETVLVDGAEGKGANSDADSQRHVEGLLFEFTAMDATRDLVVRRAVLFVLGL